MVKKTTTNGHLGGTDGNDKLIGIAQNNAKQIHIYAKAGDDEVVLDFARITKHAAGHHARGDGSGGIDDTSTNRGKDKFNFVNLHRVENIVVGRIEDFDSSRDSIAIKGTNITNMQLRKGSGTTEGYKWRIVEYDADKRDNATDTQQWLLIDTGPGYVFYALEGARVANGSGASNSGQQEAHFIGANNGHKVTLSELSKLKTVGYVDPVNYVPDSVTAKGGITINDDDNVYSDINPTIKGSNSGDLIAAGLNNDKVRGYDGDDRIWGGSGNDTINGDNGNDTIYGGTGHDKITGGRGNDLMYGQRGNDVMSGWGGNDRISGGNGSDRLYGQQGNDRLYGGNGNDKLYASTDNDLVSGGNGKDLVNGGAGSDTMTGGKGADTFEFKDGDLMDWNEISGSWTEKNRKLDVVTDFKLNEDRVEFDNYGNVTSRDDLKAWSTMIDGNRYYTIQIRDTDERFLLDVADNVTWRDLFDTRDRDGDGIAQFDEHFLIV